MTSPYSTTTGSPGLLAELLDNSPHGVVAYEAVRDANGQILDYRTIYHNAQALVITGHTARQLTDQLLFQRAPHARIQAEALRQVVEERIPHDVQELMPVDNRWFTFENRPLVGGYFTVIRDINDLKQAEQQLTGQNELLRHSADQAEQQQQLLRSVLNASPGSITVERAIRDEAGTIIDFQAILVNPAALVLGGHTEEDVLNRRISDLNPAFKTSGLMAAYQTVLDTGEPFQVEFFYPPLAKFLDISVTRLDDEHVTVLFNDITQARQNARMLQQQNDLLDGVLRTSENAIIVYQTVYDTPEHLTDFRVMLTNQAALRLFNLSLDGAVGKHVTDLYPNTKKTGLWRQYAEVCRTGVTYQTTYFDIDIERWLDVTINKLGDGLVATFSDVTLARRAAEQTESQARLFDGLLDSITSGLSVLEAIRDDAGAVVDVRYVRVRDRKSVV